MTGFIRCLLVASLILSSLEAQSLRPFSQFEVITGGATLLMPREDYHSKWGLASVSLSDTKYIIATNAALASGNYIFIG